MAVIDPEGLFNGDRLRRCSNAAQLHWPRLFLASDGFARLEINYARIVGRAYSTFAPIPSETEMQAWLQEYAKNFLLFLYEADGQVWGQWDTKCELLPRYKTSHDRRSPIPPTTAFADWKNAYREQNKGFPKCFGKVSETFLHGGGVGVGVGVGENICASGDARVSQSGLSIDNSQIGTAGIPVAVQPMRPAKRGGMIPEQEQWFAVWFPEYWRRMGKKNARIAFAKHVKTETKFQKVMTATRAQRPEMMARPKEKRPYPATWLNGECWEDETEDLATPTPKEPVRLFA